MLQFDVIMTDIPDFSSTIKRNAENGIVSNMSFEDTLSRMLDPEPKSTYQSHGYEPQRYAYPAAGAYEAPGDVRSDVRSDVRNEVQGDPREPPGTQTYGRIDESSPGGSREGEILAAGDMSSNREVAESKYLDPHGDTDTANDISRSDEKSQAPTGRFEPHPSKSKAKGGKNHQGVRRNPDGEARAKGEKSATLSRLISEKGKVSLESKQSRLIDATQSQPSLLKADREPTARSDADELRVHAGDTAMTTNSSDTDAIDALAIPGGEDPGKSAAGRQGSRVDGSDASSTVELSEPGVKRRGTVGSPDRGVAADLVSGQKSETLQDGSTVIRVGSEDAKNSDGTTVLVASESRSIAANGSETASERLGFETPARNAASGRTGVPTTVVDLREASVTGAGADEGGMFSESGTDGEGEGSPVGDMKPGAATNFSRLGSTESGADSARSFGRVFRESVNPEIVRQSSFVLKGNQQGEIRLILKPAHLGNLRVRLEIVENRITGRIIVDSAFIRDTVEQNIEDLARAFRQHGYDSAALDVTVSGERERRAGEHTPRGSTTVRRAIEDIEEHVPAMEAEYYGYVNVVV